MKLIPLVLIFLYFPETMAKIKEVYSPYVACQGYKLYEKGRSPRDCPEGSILTSRTGYTVLEIEEPIKSLGFLNKVALNVQKSLNENILAMEKISSCFNSSQCPDVAQKATEIVNEALPEYRQALAFSKLKDPELQASFEMKIPSEKSAFDDIKDQLNLSSQEILHYKEKYINETKKMDPKNGAETARSFRKMKESAKLKQLDMLQKYPMLIYINKPHVNEKEMNEALKTVLMNAKKHKKRIDEIVKSNRLSDMKEILSYNSAVEEELAKDPRDCPVATTLFIQNIYASEREMALWAASGVASTFALGFFGPATIATAGRLAISAEGLVGFAMGPAMATGFAMKDLADYKKFEQGTYSKSGLSQNEKEIYTQSQLAEAKDRAFTTSLMLPLSWIPASAAAKWKNMVSTAKPENLARIESEYKTWLSLERDPEKRKALQVMINDAEERGASTEAIKKRLDTAQKKCKK